MQFDLGNSAENLYNIQGGNSITVLNIFVFNKSVIQSNVWTKHQNFLNDLSNHFTSSSVRNNSFQIPIYIVAIQSFTPDTEHFALLALVILSTAFKAYHL